MMKSSFREILRSFLEESEAFPLPPARSTGVFAEPPLPWEWQPSLPPPIKKSTYPRPLAKPATPTPEKLLPIAQLTPVDHLDLLLLLRLDAKELNEGLSLQRLKRAHRRLAKALHPDHQAKNLSARERQMKAEDFLLLQGAYERLSRSLPLYKINGSACGNESASAPGCRHQDAA